MVIDIFSFFLSFKMLIVAYYDNIKEKNFYKNRKKQNFINVTETRKYSTISKEWLESRKRLKKASIQLYHLCFKVKIHKKPI